MGNITMPHDEEKTYARTVLLDLDVARPITDIPSLRLFMANVIPLDSAANAKGVEVFERFLKEHKLDTLLLTHGSLFETVKGRHLRIDRRDQATHFFAGSFFQDSGGRIFVPLYVRQGNVCTINFYYTSGSQMPFRLLPFVAVGDFFGKWYSKGPNGEHSLNAPFEVQASLYKWLKQDLQEGKDIPELSTDFMPNQLDGWMKKDDTPIDERLKQAQRIQSIRALRKALDPDGEDSQVFELDGDERYGVPRQTTISYEQFAQSPYGAEFGLERVICTGAHSSTYISPDLVVVPSFNNQARYLFVKTIEGSFLAATELSNSKLNLHGLNRDVIGNFPELWLTPLCEYKKQVQPPLRARLDSNGFLLLRGRYVLVDNLFEVVEFVGEFERAQRGEVPRFTRNDVIFDSEASLGPETTSSITLTHSAEIPLSQITGNTFRVYTEDGTTMIEVLPVENARRPSIPASVPSDSRTPNSIDAAPRFPYFKVVLATAAAVILSVSGVFLMPRATNSSPVSAESSAHVAVEPMRFAQFQPVAEVQDASPIRSSVSDVTVALAPQPGVAKPAQTKHFVRDKSKPKECTSENVLSVLERRFGQGIFIVSSQGAKRPYEAEFKPFPLRCSTQMRCSTSSQKCIR